MEDFDRQHTIYSTSIGMMIRHKGVLLDDLASNRPLDYVDLLKI